jgi:uncharacterized phage-associated protein
MIKTTMPAEGDMVSLNMYRNKLLNAILFFSQNTLFCNKTKLLKLLYHLDFIHFRQTGYPSIGLTYYTYEKGPVPVRFWKEIQHGVVPSDFRGKFEIEVKENAKEFIFKAVTVPDLSYFTPREQDIINMLARKYYSKTAKQISEETHLPRQPWHTTKITKGMNRRIDYLLCIDEDSGVSWDEAKGNLSEFYGVVKNFRLVATKPAERDDAASGANNKLA